MWALLSSFETGARRASVAKVEYLADISDMFSVSKKLRSTGFVLFVGIILVLLSWLYMLLTPDFGPKSQARKQDAETALSMFRSGLTEFHLDCGRYPTSREGLAALIQRPSTIARSSWRGPYLDMSFIPRDPWGRPYVYKYPGMHNTNGYDLYSLGPNGNDSGAIGNWTNLNGRSRTKNSY